MDTNATMTVPLVKPPQSMLGLPAERLTQLRALADRRGVSAVEIVERAIRSAIEAREIEDDLPGFCEISIVDDDLMAVSLRGEDLPLLDRDQAQRIAMLVDAAAGNKTSLGKNFKVGKGFGLDLGGDVQIVVGRHARAVMLALVDARTKKPTFRTATSFGIATDFARLLRAHAASLGLPIRAIMGIAASNSATGQEVQS